MKSSQTETTINSQEWADEKNAKRDPFAFEPQYFVMSEDEAKELLDLDPTFEEREVSFS